MDRLFKIVAFSLGIALLKLPDAVWHKHFEATFFHCMSHSCHSFCDDMNFLGLLKIVAFSLGIALLKLPDIVSHKNFVATASIVCPIAAILSVITGPYLDCSKMLRSAWG